MESNQRQARLASCIQTIVMVQASLDSAQQDSLLLFRFKKLEESLKNLDVSSVSESDVRRVEEATNRLLSELRAIFSPENIRAIHDERIH